MVSALLRNRRYIGEYTFAGTPYPDYMPAIITKELFDRAQSRIAKNKKAPAHYKAETIYLLTTKLHCGKCGTFMIGESGTSHTGTSYYYYKCGKAKRGKTCKKKSVKKSWIEDIVVEHAMKLVMDDEMVEAMADAAFAMLGKENAEVPRLKKQLAETAKKLKNILSAIEQGIVTDTTKDRLQELEEAKRVIEKDILKEEIKRPSLTRDKIIFWLQHFRTTDTANQEQRQRLVDIFINSIYLYDDRLIINLNYKNQTKTVSLADIKSSDLAKVAPPVNMRLLGFSRSRFLFYYTLYHTHYWSGCFSVKISFNLPVACCFSPIVT
jgi:hypothetical protein